MNSLLQFATAVVEGIENKTVIGLAHDEEPGLVIEDKALRMVGIPS
jgi:hypothetical protein